MFKERIEERQKIRAKIADSPFKQSDFFLLISESLDDHLEHRIEADKILEGILKDIQGNIANICSKNEQK